MDGLFADAVHDDTQALQQLLDKAGTVVVEDGVYCITQPLVVHDRPHLLLRDNAVIRLADGADCTMLTNDRCGKGKPNHRITVQGGTWDGNNLKQHRGKTCAEKSFYFGTLLRFDGVEDLCIRDLTCRDPETYAMQIMNLDRFTVENITFDYNMMRLNMDGVHVQGAARNGYIRNIKGATNDDLIALNCNDYYDDGLQHTITSGNIENIVVDGVFANDGYTGVRLLSCGSVMRNIAVRNVFGTYRFNGVSFTHHNIIPGAPVWFDNITLDGIYCSKHPQNLSPDPRAIACIDAKYGQGAHLRAVERDAIIWFASGVRCGNISISHVYREEQAQTKAPTVQIDASATIERLCLSDISQRFTACEAVPLLQNAGKVDQFICSAVQP